MPNGLRTLLIVLMLIGVNESRANVPASYFACEGLSDGYRCRMTGPFFGRCTVDTLCEDDEETPSVSGINECLLCVDECWSRDIGDECVMSRSGKRGLCARIPDCTPDESKSFLVCQRCEPGDLVRIAPVDACSSGMNASRLGVYGLLMVLLFLNLKTGKKS